MGLLSYLSWNDLRHSGLYFTVSEDFIAERDNGSFTGGARYIPEGKYFSETEKIVADVHTFPKSLGRSNSYLGCISQQILLLRSNYLQ